MNNTLDTVCLLPGELIVDLFAGGGGASSGIESATGRSPDIAINHDPAAIQMRYLQTLTEIAVERNSTIVFPLPLDLMRAFENFANRK